MKKTEVFARLGASALFSLCLGWSAFAQTDNDPKLGMTQAALTKNGSFFIDNIGNEQDRSYGDDPPIQTAIGEYSKYYPIFYRGQKVGELHCGFNQEAGYAGHYSY